MPAVLVVDDDSDTRSNLSDILSEFGYVVETAGSGEAALELMKDRTYDVALLDLKLPGIDGVALSQRIRERDCETVSIIVTGYAGEETRRQARDSGVWRVLSKPVDPRMLLELLETAVHSPLVLIVDDDPDLRDSLWDLLTSQGYRAALAGTGSQALERIERREFQVVLLDFKLPEGDGLQVFEAVRMSCPEAKSILITGHREELGERIRELRSRGIDAVCYKPFDPRRLLETIDALIQSGA